MLKSNWQSFVKITIKNGYMDAVIQDRMVLVDVATTVVWDAMLVVEYTMIVVEDMMVVGEDIMVVVEENMEELGEKFCYKSRQLCLLLKWLEKLKKLLLYSTG